MKNIFILVLALMIKCFSANSYPLHLSSVSPEFAQIRSNLYAIGADGSATLMDGTLTQYDTGYNNNIDGKDARKMFNPAENFGMVRDSAVLIVERRHTIQNNDTIFFKMWNMRMINYRLQFVSYHLNTPGMFGVLKDKFLKRDTPLDLNDTTNFSFTVTSDPASSAPDRFMIVFITPSLSLMPLTFTSLKAYPEDNTVKIDWATANENRLKEYQVEKAINGSDFTKIYEVEANNFAVNNYQSVDKTPVEGYNCYRIRSLSLDGKFKYSDIVKVYIGKTSPRIFILTNPVSANTLKLQIVNEQAGIYYLKLMNSLGRPFIQTTFQYAGGVATKTVSVEQQIPKGIYLLEIKTPGGKTKVITLLF